MITNPMFKGTWEARLECLFGGYSIAGKAVLDIGCNMGVVGYEICKGLPRSYTGVDRLPEHLHVARSIFHGVPVSHEFHGIDLVTGDWQGGYDYDVLFLLAVWHHMIKAHGPVETYKAMAPFFDRVTETVVVRGPPDEWLAQCLADAGLYFKEARPSSMGLHPLSIYVR